MAYIKQSKQRINCDRHIDLSDKTAQYERFSNIMACVFVAFIVIIIVIIVVAFIIWYTYCM